MQGPGARASSRHRKSGQGRCRLKHNYGQQLWIREGARMRVSCAWWRLPVILSLSPTGTVLRSRTEQKRGLSSGGAISEHWHQQRSKQTRNPFYCIIAKRRLPFQVGPQRSNVVQGARAAGALSGARRQEGSLLCRQLVARPEKLEFFGESASRPRRGIRQSFKDSDFKVLSVICRVCFSNFQFLRQDPHSSTHSGWPGHSS